MRLVMDTFGFILEAVLRSDKMEGFVVLSKRLVVEGTFGWFNYIGMTRLMLRRLA